MEDMLHYHKRAQTGDTDAATEGGVSGGEDVCSEQSLGPRKFHGQPWQGATDSQWRDWRWQFANRVRDVDTLTELLKIPFRERHVYEELTTRYPYAITPYYFTIIDWLDPNDPIKRQCVPDPREVLFSLPGSEEDPLAESAHMPVPGLIHRYPDRVLAMVTGICATYCRHCNRKRTWKRPEAVGSSHGLERMLDYVKDNAGIREVILSGGDPLIMDLRILDEFLGALRSIPHVEVLRIGTRVPVVLPMRINDSLCHVLARHRPLWINTHFNHPREITPEAAGACDRLVMSGIPVSNQTVLLKGINDAAETILTLCHGLQRIMVRPYYLFHCDAVRGTDHFRTDIRKGVEIIEALWGQTGGLCIPTFVVDLPSGGGKARMTASHLLSIEKNMAVFRTFEGRLIRYPCPEGAET